MPATKKNHWKVTEVEFPARSCSTKNCSPQFSSFFWNTSVFMLQCLSESRWTDCTSAVNDTWILQWCYIKLQFQFLVSPHETHRSVFSATTKAPWWCPPMSPRLLSPRLWGCTTERVHCSKHTHTHTPAQFPAVYTQFKVDTRADSLSWPQPGHMTPGLNAVTFHEGGRGGGGIPFDHHTIDHRFQFSRCRKCDLGSALLRLSLP